MSFGVSNIFWYGRPKFYWDNVNMDIDPAAVGRRIKAARLKAGFKDGASLAEKILQNSEKRGRKGVDPETVRLWEAGKVLPPWDKLAQITALLGVGAEELLFDSRASPQGDEIPPTIEEQEMQDDILARRLVKAWKALPENMRDDELDALEVKALQFRSRKRDTELTHLARPDSEIARAAEKRAKSKTAS
jgi:transcriptional regulator with XRE-family HTH domain